MMYEIKRTTKFKKDYKLAVKRGLDISKLKIVIQLLAEGKTLPEEYKDHSLSGEWIGQRMSYSTGLASCLLLFRECSCFNFS